MRHSKVMYSFNVSVKRFKENKQKQEQAINIIKTRISEIFKKRNITRTTLFYQKMNKKCLKFL